MTYTRIVLVYKQTPYESLLREYGTFGNARFLMESRGEDIAVYQQQHEQYYKALRLVEQSFPKDIAHTLVERVELPRFLFREQDLVLAVGPDGLFANLAKYLGKQPVIAVNPLPAEIDGVLMRFRSETVGRAITKTLAGEATFDEVVLAEATREDGARLLAVNDFLIGRSDHISARYRLALGDYEERQSSSGVLVSTGMGASGWLRSIKTAAQAAYDYEASEYLPVDPVWDEPRLVFAVREPFPSRVTYTDLVYGSITAEEPLVFTSEMPEGGVVFSDGVPEDALVLPAGSKLTIVPAAERVRLVRP